MTQEQYDRVCKGEFEEIKESLSNIHDRLFLDNGRPCFQTRLDRNERLLKVALWVIMVVSSAMIAQTTKEIIEHVRIVPAAEAAEIVNP